MSEVSRRIFLALPPSRASQPFMNLNMDWVHSLMFALTALELLCFFGAYRAKKAGWESLWILALECLSYGCTVAVPNACAAPRPARTSVCMPDACLRRVRQALPRAPVGQRARGPVAALHGLASDVPSAPHGLANPGLRLQPTAAGEARARASRQPSDDRKPARESNHDAPTEPVCSQICSPSTPTC